MHPTHVPIRVVTGAYILNSGVNKLKSSPEEEEQMHGWASSVYPVFKDMRAGDFSKLLAYGEIGLGAMLLLPTVPSAVAGGALAAFGAGLTGLYLKSPGMTQEDGIRPTQEGTAVAKDVWMAGMGLALMADGAVNRTARKNAAAARRAKRIGKAKDSKVEAINKARDEQTEALRAARHDLAELRKQI